MELEARKKLFEEMKQTVNSTECWDARQLMPAVGYSNWREFENAIDKAKVACENSGQLAEKHFLGASPKNKGTKGRPGTNYFLTRTACYFVFQNGDARKTEIAAAQAYFIQQTRKQEKLSSLNLDARRVLLRERVDSSTESLTDIATKIHDVTDVDRFHEAGSEGMYNMSVEAIETLKDIEHGKLLDRIDSAELAAHYFRTTQTEEALANGAREDHIYDQEGAEEVHRSVGVLVRSTMREAGKTLPEDLPAVEDIEPVRERIEAERRKKQLENPKNKGQEQSKLFD